MSPRGGRGDMEPIVSSLKLTDHYICQMENPQNQLCFPMNLFGSPADVGVLCYDDAEQVIWGVARPLLERSCHGSRVVGKEGKG